MTDPTKNPDSLVDQNDLNKVVERVEKLERHNQNENLRAIFNAIWSHVESHVHSLESEEYDFLSDCKDLFNELDNLDNEIKPKEKSLNRIIEEDRAERETAGDPFNPKFHSNDCKCEVCDPNKVLEPKEETDSAPAVAKSVSYYNEKGELIITKENMLYDLNPNKKPAESSPSLEERIAKCPKNADRHHIPCKLCNPCGFFILREAVAGKLPSIETLNNLEIGVKESLKEFTSEDDADLDEEARITQVMAEFTTILEGLRQLKKELEGSK